MPKLRKSIEIHAPVREVFAFLTAPEQLPKIWPSMIDVNNIVYRPEGGARFVWTYKMAGVRFNGESETLEFVPNRLWVTRSETGIPSTFRWTFAERDFGCEVTVECDYEIPGLILGKLAKPLIRRLNEHEAEIVLRNLKEEMEALFGVQPEEQPQPPA